MRFKKSIGAVLIVTILLVLSFVFAATSPATTWYLFNTTVSGVTPAGQIIQSAKSTMTGWQPTKLITTTAAYWYTDTMTGSYTAGNWQFLLWTGSPGGSSVVKAEIYKTNSNGSGAVLIGGQQVDVNTTGGGNHTSTFNYNGMAAVSLANQRLMVKIWKVSGLDVTMAYNTNDFATTLLTAPLGTGSTPTVTPNGTPTATKTPTPTPTPLTTPTPTATPGGKVIPGQIEAESYDAMFGIQTEATGDTGGGLNVGWMDAADWMDYNVTVLTTGSYTVDFRVASPYANTQLQLMKGATVLATVTIPNTGGYQTWATVSATVNLTAGAQTLRVNAVTNGWNFNWMKFTASGSGVNIPVTGPYIQYIQIGYSPTDLNGNSSLISQNTNINQTVRYSTGTNVTVSVLYLTDPKQIVFKTTNQGGGQVQGNPLTFTVHSSSAITVDVLDIPTPTPTPGITPSPTKTPTATPTPSASPTSVGAFNVLSPINGQMITSTRQPALSWQAKSGATKYEIWINTTRSDYNWYASGNLLDRYTKVGESTTTSFTAPSLVDRWTYKWYVIAVDGAGNRSQSNIGQFSVYLPTLETAADGVNIVNGSRDLNKNGTIEPYEDWHQPIQTRLNDLMSRMTNDEKFRQCFYGAENDSALNGFSFSYGVEGGMTTTQQNCAKTRLGIPTAFAGDKIHGWKTIYPTQLGLAATRDINLAYQMGNLQRIEQKSFGFTGMLMPLAEVNTKVLYPRFQEGCGENADDAAAMVRAILAGLQGGPEPNPHSLMTTVKHWPSQGAGGEGPLQYDAVTIKYHMKPWYAAVEANAISVMPGYSSCPYLDPTGTGSCTSKPIMDYLRNVIGFKGFIVTDWLGANSAQTIASMGAGADVLGGAPASSSDLNTVLASIGQARLDEAARRIVEMKLRLGMFENPYGDPTCTWNALDNHNTVLNAAKKSITLIKNNGVLPLKLTSGQNMIVGGPRATWINKDNDPNVIWQSIYYSDPYTVNYVDGFKNEGTSRGVNVYQDSASNAKVAVVVIGEKGYTHGTEWANKDPNIPADQIAVIQGFKNQGIPVVTVVITPRPYVLDSVVNISDAVMLVYRGGSSIAEAVASLSWGEYLPTGKLPFQLPRSTAQIGTDDVANQLEKWDLPYDLGATDAQRTAIRNYINNNQTVPTTYGDPLFPYGFGLQNF